jgi:hypothetical protein
MVYVLSKTGQPLMPTERHGKVKHFLQEGKAIVVKRCPFTIQLTYESKTFTQPITLGVDAGSKTIGLSATTQIKEVYASEVTLRNDIVELLSTRREYRRSRRNRTKRYRKSRFDNRRRGDDWFAPSIRQRIETHHKVVAEVCRILPISNIIIEVASFDIQKIKNPDIQGIEYQQGEQLDFWNVREYVLYRDNHSCQHCKGKSKDKILDVHHIESRKTGGDAPNNLVTLCSTCHDNHHDWVDRIKIKRGHSFKDAAFMGIMRWAFYNKLKASYPNVSLTYGYITKNTRINNKLEKTHCVDARFITGNPTVEPLPYYYNQKAVRRHNRQIHKATILKGGYRKLNQAPKYVFGFQLFDKVLYNNQECFIFGRRIRGYFDVRLLTGKRIAEPSYKKLKLLEKATTILTERGERAFLTV